MGPNSRSLLVGSRAGGGLGEGRASYIEMMKNGKAGLELVD